jgi:predicted 3-demethylubiquinone-9 3-methyltransferase (glyoxalase superfamily)
MNPRSEQTMNKITPFLWFDANAEDAANFYLSIFPGSRKLDELRTTDAGPGPKGALLAVDIEIAGQQVTFLNGGPAIQLSDAFSFVIRCESQQEIDDYWSKLTDGGSETACGWLKDKFGMSWQVVPTHIYELLRHPDAMRALMTMKKLDIATLERAASQTM